MPLKKAEAKQILLESEQSGQLYRIKSGWKGYMIATGVFLCLLVITLPLGIWFIHVGTRARLGLGEHGFAITWLTTKGWRYDEIESFAPVSLNFSGGGGGLVGALAAAAVSSIVASRTEGLKGPVLFKVKGKRLHQNLPAHAIQRSFELAEELQRRTGLPVLKPLDAA